jgi:hypothetical protein
MASVSRATSRCSAAVSGWRAGLRLPVPVPAPASAVGAGVPQDHAGLAAALITASFQLGSALGLAVFTGIATSRTSHLLAAHTPAPEALTAGFQRGLLVSALCLAAAGAIARLQHPRRTCRHTRNPAKPGTLLRPRMTAQRNPGMAFNAIPGFSLPSGA